LSWLEYAGCIDEQMRRAIAPDLATKILENPLVAEETVRRLVGHVDLRMLQRCSHIRVTLADKTMEAMDTPPTCSDPPQSPRQITLPSSPLLQ
jgi:hypothetical protein